MAHRHHPSILHFDRYQQHNQQTHCVQPKNEIITTQLLSHIPSPILHPSFHPIIAPVPLSCPPLRFASWLMDLVFVRHCPHHHCVVLLCCLFIYLFIQYSSLIAHSTVHSAKSLKSDPFFIFHLFFFFLFTAVHPHSPTHTHTYPIPPSATLCVCSQNTKRPPEKRHSPSFHTPHSIHSILSAFP